MEANNLKLLAIDDSTDILMILKREANEFCRRLGEPLHHPSQEAGSVAAKDERP